MRLTIFLLITSLVQVSAAAFGQNINLSTTNAPLKTVLKEIRKQSGYNFVYTDDQLSKVNPITIDLRNTQLGAVLEQVFKDQRLTYSVDNKTIIIMERERSALGGDPGLSAFSEVLIQGQVIDSVTLSAVSYATISFTVNGVLKRIAADRNGVFAFYNIRAQAIELNILSIGYQVQQLKINADEANTTTLKLGQIKLVQKAENVQQVTVNGIRPLVSQKIDGITYDVQADPESKTATTLDILRKVPMVQIGLNGITVNDAKTYLVLLNGKPYAIYKNQPMVALANLMALKVEKIEILTVPPTRFANQGYTEVINVITLSDPISGFQANIKAAHSTPGDESGSLTTDAKVGAFGLSNFVTASYNRPIAFKTASSLNFNNPTKDAVLEEGRDRRKFKTVYYNSELSIELDTVNLILLNAVIISSDLVMNEVRNIRYYQSEQLVSSQKNDNHFGVLSNEYAGEFYYQNEGRKHKTRIFTLGYKFDKLFEHKDAVTSSIKSDVGNNSLLLRNKVRFREHQFQLDYVLPIQKVTLEMGFKTVFRDNYTNSDNAEFDYAANVYRPDNNILDIDRYNQNVYSVYQSWYYKQGKYGVKVNAQYQNTLLDYVSVTRFRKSFNNLIPAVNVQHLLEKGSVDLNYQQKIERPSINQINPFVDATNPNYIRTGNIALEPSVVHNFGAVFTHRTPKNFFRFNLTYAFGNHPIEPVVNKLNDTSLIVTFKNIGAFNNLSLNTSASLSPTRQFDLSLNLTGSYISKKGQDGIFAYKNDGFKLGSSLNTSYVTRKKWRYSLSATVVSPDVLLQGSGPWFINTSFFVTRRFLANRASFTGILNSPLDQYRKRKDVSSNALYQRINQSWEPTRSLYFAFSYRIGNLKERIKKTNTRIESSDLNNGKKL